MNIRQPCKFVYIYWSNIRLCLENKRQTEQPNEKEDHPQKLLKTAPGPKVGDPLLLYFTSRKFLKSLTNVSLILDFKDYFASDDRLGDAEYAVFLLTADLGFCLPRSILHCHDSR